MTGRGKFDGKHSELTGKILGAFFHVHKELGYGFSEKVYENALTLILTENGLKVDQQVHSAEFRRKVYDNERKGSLSWIDQPSFP